MVNIRINTILLTVFYLLLVALTSCQTTTIEPWQQNAIDRNNAARYQAQQQWAQNSIDRFNQQNRATAQRANQNTIAPKNKHF